MRRNPRVAAVLAGTLATTAVLAATASSASAAGQEVPGSGGQPFLAFFGPLFGAVLRPVNVSVDIVTFVFERLSSNHAEDLVDEEI